MSITSQMQQVSRAILYAQELHAGGMTVLQMIVLFSLPENGTVSFGEVLKRLNSWPDSTLHRHCKKLLMDRLIVYTRDAYDARCATYHLSNKGRDLRARIADAAGFNFEKETQNA